ncbi:MAG: hypothetical protein Q4P23_01630 [Micrococcaceae bacterium]|nr:hypothetical protein [Micrococcaceae bacterium]
MVYESMFGVTHRAANAICLGLCQGMDAMVFTVHEADPLALGNPDLLVIGAPTQEHGLSLPLARADAVTQSLIQSPRQLDQAAGGIGVREWLAVLPSMDGFYAAFDTRLRKIRLATGSAAAQIDRRLRSRGLIRAIASESFFISSATELEDGEEERARDWGEELARLFSGFEPGSPGGTKPDS